VASIVSVGFTIASKNYISAAGVLAASFRERHPNGHFIIILCDRIENYDVEKYAGGAEVIEASKLGIPDFETFVYRYSIMELNTAVKPFAFEYLFRTRAYDTIIYLDPDIWIHRPLDRISAALNTADIALIPHMRRPFFDQESPSDVSIVQSGTYNLGFIGLRRGAVADRLLSWWSEKLFMDCVVDIPRGLFVDQKWIDLVPGFFPSHAIIHDPTYNVAYWNLHERTLSVSDDGAYIVEGVPLTFFHFSGYSPFEPTQLSKHQNRHDMRWHPALRRLHQDYGQLLFANGYDVTAHWPFSFEILTNGIHLPMRLAREAVQWALRHNMKVPNPITDADKFCAFLMGKRMPESQVPLVIECLLERRPDVAKAFPGARYNFNDPGFQKWLTSSGLEEEQIGELLKFRVREQENLVAAAFDLLRKNQRIDVLFHYKDMWNDRRTFEQFAEWFDVHGVSEHGIQPGYGKALKAAYDDLGKILSVYFLRPDLQRLYPVLESEEHCKDYISWLVKDGVATGISTEAASLFTEFVAGSPDLIATMRFLYQHLGRQRTSASVFLLEERCAEMVKPPSDKVLTRYLLQDELIDLYDQYKLAIDHDSRFENLDDVWIPHVTLQQSDALIQTIRDHKDKAHNGPHINFASYITAPSGMGESGRSMQRLLLSTGAAVHQCILPHPYAQLSPPFVPSLFGWPSTAAQTSITVANADSVATVKTILPSHYWTERNIGYWVWETEELPIRFEDAAHRFSEIWTPSEYSAAAVRRTIDKPVTVVPHSLDLPAIAAAKADRARFEFPKEGVLFGFMLDVQSMVERKNLRGLLEAFMAAFVQSENAYLVVKVNGATGGSFDYKRLRAQFDDPRIIYFDKTLTRAETFEFMASLDAYTSLHRSEGFGLTCAEAMALAKPVIATNYSGNVDFMNNKNSMLVPARVIETDRPYGPYPAGTRWGDPSLEAAADAMRRMLDKDLRTEIGQTAKSDILARLDTARIAKAVARHLDLGAPTDTPALQRLYAPNRRKGDEEGLAQ